MNATECIEAALKTFKERAAVYGDSYTRHGKVMSELFPEGLKLESIDDFNRFGILNMQVSKLIRYTQSWKDRHIDSSHDMGVYCFMQEELDRAFHKLEELSLATYVAIEIYDNRILYDGKEIYSGCVKNKTKKEIDLIVDDYKRRNGLCQ